MNLFNLHFNWVDLVIIAVLIYFASEAWRVGFWIILTDFIGFLASLLIALRIYPFAAQFLRNSFQLSHSLANALGFLVVAVISEAFIGLMFFTLVNKISTKFWKKPWNNLLAVIPSLGEGLVIVSFILTLALSLPIIPKVKTDINNSCVGGYIINRTQGLEKSINEVFGGIIEDSLTYLTVNPESKDAIRITAEKKNLSVDEVAEVEMFNLVNEERRKMGVAHLKWRPELVPVARAHATDMWDRSYFGHVSPDGEDVGDRLEKANVSYQLAGENLALAPTLQTAHNGLMNSEGHRRNILDPEFKRMGVGVIDNGVYGKMFVQIFSD